MKKLLDIGCAAFLLAAVVSCGYDDPEAPVPAKAAFLDVNVTFTHPKVKPQAGQTLVATLYYTDVQGVSVASLTPAMRIDTELTETQVSKGLRLSLEPVDRTVSAMYVLLWVDQNTDGRLDEGELAAYYDAAGVDKVEAGETAAQSCLSGYAVNMKLGRVYGEAEIVIPEGQVADYDMNLYTEVEIGPQFWLKEHLRTTHFADGTEIPSAAGEAFQTYGAAAYVNPYSTLEDVEKFGLLYNWYAATQKNPCPEGYRIPTEADMLVLEKYIAPEAADLGDELADVPEASVFRANAYNLGLKMMSSAYDFGGTDDYGLSLVPGGIYAASLSKDASAATKICVLWMADESPTNTSKGVRRMFQNGRPGAARGCDSKAKGQSLRCMRDNPDYVAIVLEQLAAPQLTVSGTVVSWNVDGHASGYEVSIDDIRVSDPEITTAQGVCSFDATSVKKAQNDDRKYRIGIVALGDGAAYKNSERSSTEVTVPGTGAEPVKEYVYDKDGNKYSVVSIGTQTWMCENLRTTKFADGTEIPSASGNAFKAYGSAAYVNPYSTAENVEKFGLLYNWYAATEKNPCPEGYRIPTEADMLVLEKFVAPEATDLGTALSDVPEKAVWCGADAGLATKIKSGAYGFGGSDDYGLSLVPGGIYATALSKDASAATKICVLWLADESPTNTAKGVRRMLQHDKSGSARGCDDKAKGQSLRCMKN